MNPGDICELEFPFQEGQGAKKRPVLIFVLTATPNEFIGLKITGTPKHNRVPIHFWNQAGLTKPSYVQCDNYSVFQHQGNLVIKGRLHTSDYNQVVLKFNNYYSILNQQSNTTSKGRRD